MTHSSRKQFGHQASLSTYTTLLTLYGVVFLNTIGYFLIFPVLSKIVNGQEQHIIPQGWSAALGDYLFPTVLATGSIAGLIFGPLLGRWSDIIGRKRLLIICTLLTWVSFVLPVMALVSGSLVVFMVGNAINGIASNNQQIAQASISDLSQRSFSKVIRYAIDVFVICVAMVVGPLAGYELSTSTTLAWWGDKTPFIVAGSLTVVAFILLLIMFPETNRYSQDRGQLNYHTSVGSFSDVIHLSPRAWRLLILIFLVQGAWAQFFQYVYIYLPRYLGFSQHATSDYVSLLGVYLSVGLLVILPILIRFMSCQRIIVICAIISMLSFVAQVIWPELAWWWAVPLAITMAMYYPCVLTLLTRSGSIKEQGWLMTLNGFMLNLSWLITAFTAILFSHWHFQLPIAVSGIIMLVASVVAIVEMRHCPRIEVSR